MSLVDNGFEEGDFTYWTSTNGSPAVIDTDQHHETYCAEMDADYERCEKTHTAKEQPHQYVSHFFYRHSQNSTFRTQVEN